MIRHDFSGKVALITGGASGIGLATARLFLEAGARVMVADLPHGSEAAMAALTPSATGGGELAFVAVDVTDPVSVSAMVQACVRRFGVLDIAVNSAGIAHGGIPTASYPLAEWKRVLDVNLNGVFYCMQA